MTTDSWVVQPMSQNVVAEADGNNNKGWEGGHMKIKIMQTNSF